MTTSTTSDHGAARKIIKRGVAGALGLGIGAAAFLGVAPAALADAPTSNVVDAGQGVVGGPATQLYELNLTSSNKLLTDHGNSMSAGTRMDLFREIDASAHVPQANQLWQFVPDNGADDLFQGSWGKLKNAQSGLCLNLQGGTTATFTPVIQWTCGSYANEEFKAVPTAPGSRQFTIVSQMDPTMGIGVNDDDGQVDDNFPAISRPTAVLPVDTTWTITRIGGTPIVISNRTSADKVLDSNNAGQDWGIQAITQQIDATRQGEQQWYLQQVGRVTVNTAETQISMPVLQATANVYRLVSVHDNDWAHATCLGAHGDQPTAGAVVDTYGCDPNGIDQPNQEWIFDNYASLNFSTSSVRALNTGVGCYSYGCGLGQNAFVMYNAAMLAPSATTLSYPVLSVNTFTVLSGSKLTMENQGSTYSPADDQVWSWIYLPAPAPASGSAGSGSSGGTSSSCVGMQCLVDGSPTTLEDWWSALVAATS